MVGGHRFGAQFQKFLKRCPPQNNIFVVNVLDKNMIMKKAFDI
jgi:hypothetical protein